MMGWKGRNDYALPEWIVFLTFCPLSFPGMNQFHLHNFFPTPPPRPSEISGLEKLRVPAWCLVPFSPKRSSAEVHFWNWNWRLELSLWICVAHKKVYQTEGEREEG